LWKTRRGRSTASLKRLHSGSLGRDLAGGFVAVLRLHGIRSAGQVGRRCA
jgi:hypothetical protein